LQLLKLYIMIVYYIFIFKNYKIKKKTYLPETYF
jgi:hypothetical protein